MRAYILSLAPSVGAVVAMAMIKTRSSAVPPVPVPVRVERRGRR